MRLVFALLLFVVAACTQSEESPEAIVEQLFADHFMSDMAFTPESVARKRDWLTPELNQQIDAYFQRPAVPDEVPVINGDPFTNTQEYPSSFEIDAVMIDASTANVVVLMTIGADKRAVQVQLILQDEGWLVDDLLYEDGSTFRALLEEQP